jgi:hypothetical protein
VGAAAAGKGTEGASSKQIASQQLGSSESASQQQQNEKIEVDFGWGGGPAIVVVRFVA